MSQKNQELPDRNQESRESSKATDVDKAAFVSAVLSGKPFTRTIRCLDGRVSVTFASLPWKVIDLINHSIPATEPDTRFMYLMACSFQSMVDAKGEYPVVSFPALEDPSWSEIEERFEDFQEKLGNEASLAVIGNAFREFEELRAELYEKVLEPDFWKTR